MIDEHEIIRNLKLTAQDMAVLCKHQIRLAVDETQPLGVKAFLPGQDGYEEAPFEVKTIWNHAA